MLVQVDLGCRFGDDVCSVAEIRFIAHNEL